MDTLVDDLAADLDPVSPLASPRMRALRTLACIALVAAPVTYFIADFQQLASRYSGQESRMMLEMAAALVTGVLAVMAAFTVAIPGRSRLWLAAPVVPFMAWLLLSGFGCLEDLSRAEMYDWRLGESLHCLVFISLTSAALSVPLAWSLSRARPIDALPVALLAGLGTAALGAFLLQFFHPFSVTFIDLGVHVATMLGVVSVAGLLNRRMLRPA